MSTVTSLATPQETAAVAAAAAVATPVTADKPAGAAASAAAAITAATTTPATDAPAAVQTTSQGTEIPKDHARLVISDDETLAVTAPKEVTLKLTQDQIGKEVVALTTDQMLEVARQTETTKISPSAPVVETSTAQATSPDGATVTQTAAAPASQELVHGHAIVAISDKGTAVSDDNNVTLTLAPGQVGQPDIKLTSEQVMELGKAIEPVKVSENAAGATVTLPGTVGGVVNEEINRANAEPTAVTGAVAGTAQTPIGNVTGAGAAAVATGDTPVVAGAVSATKDDTTVNVAGAAAIPSSFADMVKKAAEKPAPTGDLQTTPANTIAGIVGQGAMNPQARGDTNSPDLASSSRA